MLDHATRDLLGYGRAAPALRWPEGCRLAVSVVMNYEEGSENAESQGDAFNEIPVELSGSARTRGVSGQRDLHSESSFEFGARAGVWRLLDIMDKLEVPLTWFAAPAALELNPEVCRAIRERADEVAGHGLRWGGKRHSDMTLDEERTVIRSARDRIEVATGQRPVGWFTRYAPGQNTRALLVESGFRYDSDAFSDDRPYRVSVNGHAHVIVPYSFTYNDNRFVVPQGFASPADFVDEFRRAVDWMAAEGARGRIGFLSLGLHPRIAGQAGRASAVHEALQHARRVPGVWFATRRELADIT